MFINPLENFSLATESLPVQDERACYVYVEIYLKNLTSFRFTVTDETEFSVTNSHVVMMWVMSASLHKF